MAETTLFSADNVLVTDARIVIYNTTYAVRNVTSVTTMQLDRQDNAGAYLCLLFGIPMALGATYFYLMTRTGNTLLPLIGGIALVGAGIEILNTKPTYTIILGSTSGEAHTLTTKDLAYLRDVEKAINDAIILQK